MDVVEILSSINKASIFFFIITLGVLGYEFYLFRKEKKKKEKPTIPTFNPSQQVRSPSYNAVPLRPDAQEPIKKHKNIAVIATIVVVAVFGVALLLTIQKTQVPEQPPPPVSTKATTEIAAPSPPTATDSASVTATTSASSASPLPTEVLIAQSQSPTPTSTSSAVGGAVLTNTPTPTSSPTPSPTSVSTETGGLPVAGFSQPQTFIFLLGVLTILFSIVF